MHPKLLNMMTNHLLPQKSAACETGGPKQAALIDMVETNQVLLFEPPTTAVTLLPRKPAPTMWKTCTAYSVTIAFGIVSMAWPFNAHGGSEQNLRSTAQPSSNGHVELARPLRRVRHRSVDYPLDRTVVIAVSPWQP